MTSILLKYLNKQLASEYDSMISYMFLASQQDDQGTAELLLEFSREELDHAAMLIRMITDQGGAPAQPLVEYRPYSSLLASVVLSVAEEESAVAMYEMIRQILTDPREQALIDQTIEEEKRHYERLQAILERLRAERAQSGK